MSCGGPEVWLEFARGCAEGRKRTPVATFLADTLNATGLFRPATGKPALDRQEIGDLDMVSDGVRPLEASGSRRAKHEAD